MPPSRTPAAESSAELGSFRDPDSRVFLRDGAVYRALSQAGLQDWQALAATPLAGDERIPFVSYPYEWPFSMLKDAALRILAVDPDSRVPERRLALTPWDP